MDEVLKIRPCKAFDQCTVVEFATMHMHSLDSDLSESELEYVPNLRTENNGVSSSTEAPKIVRLFPPIPRHPRN